MQLSKLKVTLIATTLALSTAFLSQANAFGRDKDKYREFCIRLSHFLLLLVCLFLILTYSPIDQIDGSM